MCAVISVIVGYLVFALSAAALFQLTGRDPHAVQPIWFETITIVYGIVFAALGGFVAARIARTNARRQALAVAVVLAVGATFSLIASPGAGATWSQWAALVLMAPAAYLGGFRIRQ
jgi:MFS-type transporter involved in bile tolerance (Atg22 family)